MVKRFLLTMLLLTCSALLPLHAASLSARVDRQTLEEGQTLTLELTARGVDEAPDMSPLDADFEVLRSSRSSKLSVVNGKMDQRVIWQYSLSPKRTGKLKLPALGVTGARSEAIDITVSAAASASGKQEHRDVFLEVDVSPSDPWVQGQAVYRLRLFHARSLVEGTLSGPVADGLEVQTLGDDVKYEERRGGRRYAVLERRYALFPQRSGRMLVTPPVLTARLRARGQSGDGLLSQQRTVRLRGERLSLDVRTRPDSFSGRWWLPAQKLSLKAEWSSDPAQARVGEPITRSILLQALGLPAAQLPELSPPQGDGFKIYPDRAELEDKISAEAGLLGQRIEKWAIVPTQTGPLTLPAVSLPWWNTETGREELLSLPETEINVLPALLDVQLTPSAVAPERPLDADEAAAGGFGSQAILLGLAGVGWGLALCFSILWWRLRGQPRAAPVAREARPQRGGKRDREAEQQLAEACAGSDPKQVEQSLLDWAEQRWQQRPRSLLALAEWIAEQDGDSARCEAINDTLQRLDAARYGGAADAGLWRDLPRLLSQLESAPETASASGDPLPQL